MKLIVAIDHKNSSFEKYAKKKLSGAEINMVRNILLERVISTNVNGVVIPHSYDFTFNSHNSKEVIIGLPDIIDWSSDLDMCNEVICKLIDNSRQTLKIGFYVSKPIELKPKINELIKLLNKGQFENCKWILEPYFDLDLEITERLIVLEELKKISRIYSFKLDFDNPDKFNSQYSNICKPYSWFCRSDGMSFEPYLRNLNNMKQFNCTGGIVGAAIWKDFLNQILDDSRLSIENNNVLINRTHKILAI